MAVDPNEVIGFVSHCTNPAYLHGIMETIRRRLVKLGAENRVCRVCRGTLKYTPRVGGRDIEKPCPCCVPVDLVDAYVI